MRPMNKYKVIVSLIGALSVIIVGSLIIIYYCTVERGRNAFPKIQYIESVSISIRTGDAYSRLPLTLQQKQQVGDALCQFDSSSYEKRQDHDDNMSDVLIFVVLDDASEILLKKINGSTGYTVTFDRKTAEKYSKNYIVDDSNFNKLIDRITGGE